MKLHRIQVTNLNSLYGDHAVDLDHDLQGASLFLIQGPTGAGKSTLTDAVSLALFGTTPRLEDLRSEQAVAEQVMSRGTGEAQAVVEFSKWEREHSRRVRYRATWSARRARKRPEGNVQPTERSIERFEPDGSACVLVSDKRAKVFGPEFNRVLEGFTPHDFQRSMLLAQGRFDAMLHASPDERAEILERLTDTRVYQHLGERAARMRGAWKSRLDALQARTDSLSPVTPERLQELRAAAEKARTTLKDLDARIARHQRWRDWLRRRAALHADQEQARQQQSQVARHEREFEPERAALTEHERCQPAFQVLDRHQRALDRVRQVQGERDRKQATLPGLRQAADQAEQRSQAAEHALDQTRQALEALREPVRIAMEARRREREAAGELEQAEATRREARTELQAATTRLESATATAAQARTALDRAQDRFQALQADAPLVKALPDLARRAAETTERRRQLLQEGEQLQRQARHLEQRAEQLRQDRQAHQDRTERELTPRRRAHEQATAALQELVGDSEPGQVLEDLENEQESQRRQDRELEAALQALEALQQAREQVERRAERVEQAQQAVQARHKDLQTCEADQQRRARDLESAERVLAPLERIAELSAQRADLSERERCPLCGSRDHPFVDDPDQQLLTDEVQAELEQARQARGAAREALQAAERDTATAREQRAAAQARLDPAQEELQAARKAAVQAETRAHEVLARVDLEPDATARVVNRARTRLQQRIQDAGERHDRIRRQREAAAAAREALLATERDLNEAQAALEQRGSALEEARSGHRQDREHHRQAEAGLEARRAALARDLAPFGIEATPPESGLDQANERVEAWNRAEKALEQARIAHERATTAVAHATEARDRARHALEQAGSTLARRRAALERVQAELRTASEGLAGAWQRAVALDAGEPVDRPPVESDPQDLLESQRQRVTVLERRLHRARKARDEATRELDAARTRLTSLDEQLQAESQRRDELRAELDAALARLHLPDLQALRDRRLDADRVPALRNRREALQRDRTEADAALKAAENQLARHQADRPDSLPDDATERDLALRLEELAAERAERNQELEKATTDLGVAERTARDHEQAREALNRAREQARPWLRLHELIGIREGKAFQRFAQALNLDRLLGRANRHLERLDDRYRLRTDRDPDTGEPTLEFVVQDRWKPGTTRSLKTLSGGESFLVSLALALGLSDLRTSSMPVETLLLDEGFGTLDPQTLDLALAALQQLQSTGRQVGIISHVVGLQEAIEARIVVEPLGEGRSRVRTCVGGR